MGFDTHRSWRDIFGDGKKPLRPLRKFDADADNETDGAVEDSSAAVAAGTSSASAASSSAAAAAGEVYCNWDMKAARERDIEDGQDARADKVQVTTAINDMGERMAEIEALMPEAVIDRFDLD